MGIVNLFIKVFINIFFTEKRLVEILKKYNLYNDYIWLNLDRQNRIEFILKSCLGCGPRADVENMKILDKWIIKLYEAIYENKN